MRPRARLFIIVSAFLLMLPALAAAEDPPRGTPSTIAFIEGAPFPRNCDDASEGIQAFKRGLHDLGHVIGQTVAIERRCFHDARSFDDALRLPADLTVLVRADAEMAAHGTIRIIAIRGIQLPEGAGLFSSLALPRPQVPEPPRYVEADTKRLELLKVMIPQASRFGVLTERGPIPDAPWEVSGRALGLRVQTLNARTVEELDSALMTIRRERLEGLMVREGTVVFRDRHRAMKWFADKRLPVAFAWHRFADDGALMSYGVDIVDLYGRFAWHVDRILRGLDIAEVPVERPKLELVVNIKTARALGLRLPEALLHQADRLIE